MLDEIEDDTIDCEFILNNIEHLSPVFENLSLNMPNSSWFDNKNTLSINETRDDLIKNAIIKGIDELSKFDELKDISPLEWKYGLIHTAYFVPLTQIEAFSHEIVPISGDRNTIAAVFSSGFNEPSTGGASQRFICDLSGYDNNFHSSLSVIPGGSSSDPVSYNYDDQLDLFLEGKYHSLWFYNSKYQFKSTELDGIWNFKPMEVKK